MTIQPLPEQVSSLRIYIGELDKYEGRPLFEVLVEEARRQGLAGASVIRGISGYGANSRVHTAKILRLSADLPLIVEIIDAQDKIEQFLPFLEKVMDGGLATLEKVTVLHYSQKNGS